MGHCTAVADCSHTADTAVAEHTAGHTVVVAVEHTADIAVAVAHTAVVDYTDYTDLYNRCYSDC